MDKKYKATVCYDKNGKPFSIGDVVITDDGEAIEVMAIIDYGATSYTNLQVRVAPKGTVPVKPSGNYTSKLSVVWGGA